MKCITCNRSSGSMIYGIKQNYLVCSECLKKYKPEIEAEQATTERETERRKTRARRLALQLEVEERVHKYMVGV